MLISWKISPYPASNPDGTAYSAATNLATTQAPSTLIADAHKAGLFVHLFTFRNESRYLANDYDGNPIAEYLKFFRLGVDGVFTDFSSTGVTARTAYLEELGISAPARP